MHIKTDDPATILIVVCWPRGLESADPNDHYRPWLEENVGKQGVDWDWGLRNSDAHDHTLSIRFKREYEMMALTAKMMWS